MELSLIFFSLVLTVATTLSAFIIYDMNGQKFPSGFATTRDSLAITEEYALSSPGELQEEIRGYVLILKGKEQLTSGALGLLSQGCLFNKISDKVRLVEPFIFDSLYGFPNILTNAKNQKYISSNISFFDLYDEHNWLNLQKKYLVSPFSDWESFINNAPKEVILVLDEWGGAVNRAKINSIINKSLSHYGFHIKRVVIKNFRKTGKLSLEKFRDLVYQNDNPEDVTVIFNKLGLISQAKPANWYESIDVNCANNDEKDEVNSVELASIIHQKHTDYVNEFMNKPYLSIMFRTEHMLTKSKQENWINVIAECLNVTMNSLKQLKEKTGLDSVFVALDLGEHGSNDVSNRLNNEMAHRVREKIKTIIPMATEGALEFHGWDQSFDQITGAVPSGFTATLQKSIASGAECMILVGGGRFQKHAYNLYMSKRKGREPCVINLDKGCKL